MQRTTIAQRDRVRIGSAGCALCPILAHFSTEISHVPRPLLCRADIEFSFGTQWARNCA
jgi:hypothetical protein